MAVLGDSVGYWSGMKLGPKIFSKPNSFLWNKNNIDKTSAFFTKHGNKTITLARFVPIVRTFAPILAGVGNMKYQTFIFWNILGGALWTGSMILGGYFLGNLVTNVDDYILPVVAVIIFLSFVPVIVEVSKNWKERRDEIQNL
jgi:membrane-associated protein